MYPHSGVLTGERGGAKGAELKGNKSNTKKVGRIENL